MNKQKRKKHTSTNPRTKERRGSIGCLELGRDQATWQNKATAHLSNLTRAATDPSDRAQTSRSDSPARRAESEGAVGGLYNSKALSNSYTFNDYDLYAASEPHSAPLDSSSEDSAGSTSTSSAPSSRNWLSEFNIATKLIRQITPSTDIADRLKAYQTMHDLCSDFKARAEKYSSIIISEMGLPEPLKSMKVTPLGGIAGGWKFKAGGLLFKFAHDNEGWFEGSRDRAPEKITGLEFNGLLTYHNLDFLATEPKVKRIHTTIACLVDYLGYRVICMALIPLSMDSHVYGTSDGGVTIKADHSEFLKSMAKTAQLLNLVPHPAGKEGRVVYSAADIEGHIGTDGKFYLLDFSRFMPPEPPSKSFKNGHLYRVLRPRLVASSEVPLCPDTYTFFVSGDQTDYQRGIGDLWNKLHHQVIPQFVAKLETLNSKDNFEFLTELHLHGINVRFIGRVYTLLKSEYWRRTLLLEMLTRVVKVQLRTIWKKDTASYGEAHSKDLTVHHLNMLLGSSNPNNTSYWSEIIIPTLRRKFILTITQDLPDFKNTSDWKYRLLRQISDMCGLKWHNYFYRTIRSIAHFFEVNTEPIPTIALRSLLPIIKQMNVAHRARAYLLKAQSQSLSMKDSEILQEAVAAYKESLRVFPRDVNSLVQLGKLLVLTSEDPATKNYAMGLFHRAIEIDPNFQLAKDELNYLMGEQTMPVSPRKHSSNKRNSALKHIRKPLSFLQAAQVTKPNAKRTITVLLCGHPGCGVERWLFNVVRPEIYRCSSAEERQAYIQLIRKKILSSMKVSFEYALFQGYNASKEDLNFFSHIKLLSYQEGMDKHIKNLWGNIKTFYTPKTPTLRYLNHFIQDITTIFSSSYEPTPTDIFYYQEWDDPIGGHFIHMMKRCFNFVKFKKKELEDFSEQLQSFTATRDLTTVIYFVDLGKLLQDKTTNHTNHFQDGGRMFKYIQHHFSLITSTHSFKNKPIILFVHSIEELSEKLKAIPDGLKAFKEKFEDYNKETVGGHEIREYTIDKILQKINRKAIVHVLRKSVEDTDTFNEIWNIVKASKPKNHDSKREN